MARIKSFAALPPPSAVRLCLTDNWTHLMSRLRLRLRRDPASTLNIKRSLTEKPSLSALCCGRAAGQHHNHPPVTAVRYPAQKPNRPPILRLEGPMAGLRETCRRVLGDHLATAHRPTVPPTGERTVIIVVAVAVADHLFKVRHLPKDAPRLSATHRTVKHFRFESYAPLWFDCINAHSQET
jgi:hypothetical protein